MCATLVCIAGVLAPLLIANDMDSGEDPRVQTVKTTLMLTFVPTGHDVVVETVLDPILGRKDRRQLLEFYCQSEESITRNKAWMRGTFFPRFDRMYKEMPGEDPLSLIHALEGMAYAYRDEDGNDLRMLQFLREELLRPDLSPARRIACTTLLGNLGSDGHGEKATSAAWLTEERRIVALMSAGRHNEAYRVTFSIVADARRCNADRHAALAWLGSLLSRPTGVAFDETRQKLEALCVGCPSPVLCEALARSTMRAAFLQSIRPQDVLDVVGRLSRSTNAVAREVAVSILRQIEKDGRDRGLDIGKHVQEAEGIVQQAKLDARGREEFRRLMAHADYRWHPVGGGPRWWMLGKFLARHNALAASTDAFTKYLETRSPCAAIDDRLREALKHLHAASDELGREPVAFWAGLTTKCAGRTSVAFVQALIHELDSTHQGDILPAVGRYVLSRHPRSDAARAVVQHMALKASDFERLSEADPHGLSSGWARVGLAAALAREGRYDRACTLLDLSLSDPLPGVPFFRVVGVAEHLLDQGKLEDGETLVRGLMRRGIAATQRAKLLVFLMAGYLEARVFDDAYRIGREISERYLFVDAETLADALSTCLGNIGGKEQPRAEILLTRLLCQVLNGEIYYQTTRTDSSASPAALDFWRAVLGWSRDHRQTAPVHECLDRMSTFQDADLARILLARSALDDGDTVTASQLLSQIEESSPYSARAASEMKRLNTHKKRAEELSEVVSSEALRLAGLAERDAVWPVATESYLLGADYATDAQERLRLIAEAMRCCGAGGQRARFQPDIAGRLSEIGSAVVDQESLAVCERLMAECQQWDSGTGQAADARVTPLDEPLANSFASSMQRLGAAFRDAGSYREAAACLHAGFLRAPFSEHAPDLLRDEASILWFYLGDLEKAERVLRQAVALYPCSDSGEWASVRLASLEVPHPPM